MRFILLNDFAHGMSYLKPTAAIANVVSSIRLAKPHSLSAPDQCLDQVGATDPCLGAINDGAMRVVVEIYRDQRQFRIVNYTMKCPMCCFCSNWLTSLAFTGFFTVTLKSIAVTFMVGTRTAIASKRSLNCGKIRVMPPPVWYQPE